MVHNLVQDAICAAVQKVRQCFHTLQTLHTSVERVLTKRMGAQLMVILHKVCIMGSSLRIGVDPVCACTSKLPPSQLHTNHIMMQSPVPCHTHQPPPCLEPLTQLVLL